MNIIFLLKVDLNYYPEKSHFCMKTAHFYIRYHYFINFYILNNQLLPQNYNF